MIDLLKKLSDSFDKETLEIIKAFSQDTEIESEVFEGPICFESLDTRPASLQGKYGIYIFKVLQTMQLSSGEVRRWNSIKGAGFNTTLGKNIKENSALYLGSRVNNSIYVRTRQHFLKDGEHTSLKLKNSCRKCMLNCVRIYAFPIKEKYEGYLRIIAPAIEKRLHNQLQPLAGSSRC